MPVKRTKEEARAYMKDYRARRKANGGRPLGVKDHKVPLRHRIAVSIRRVADWMEGR